MKIRYLTVCGALLLMTGCFGTGGGGELTTYPVTGTITMNGSPVPGATVTFSPRGDDQLAAYGRTDSSGNYSLTTYDTNDGAAAGKYVVLVVKNTGSTEASPEDEIHGAVTSGGAPAAGHGGGGGGGDTDEGGSLLPEKYASQSDSGLEADVTPNGENKFDFDLQP